MLRLVGLTAFFKDRISEVFLAFDISIFRPNELMFLNEYCCVMRYMQPLASASEILQAETKFFIGYLLPTLASHRAKLLRIRPTLKLTIPLADAILTGLDARYT